MNRPQTLLTARKLLHYIDANKWRTEFQIKDMLLKDGNQILTSHVQLSFQNLLDQGLIVYINNPPEEDRQPARIPRGNFVQWYRLTNKGRIVAAHRQHAKEAPKKS